MVDVKQDIDDAFASLEARRLALREHLANTPVPPGLVSVSDATFMAAVQQMINQYPPQQIRTPSGEVIVESPWIVMLGQTNVAGAEDVLHRIELIRSKHEAAAKAGI